MSTAKLLEINPIVEQELQIDLLGNRITCFLAYSPFPIVIGQVYEVELNLQIFDDYVLSEANSNTPKFSQISNGFAYDICGVLEGKFLITEFCIFEDEYFSAFHEFQSKRVQLTVSRIDIEFIRPLCSILAQGF